MKNTLYSLCVAGLLCAPTYSAHAHHSGSPHFDYSKSVTIEGLVTEFKLVNPHAYIYLDVTDENGKVSNWNCEMNAASGLRRQGWTKELFAPGTAVKITGSEARRDPHGCAFSEGLLADGTKVERSGAITKGDTAVQVAQSAQPAIIADPTSIVGTWTTTPRNRGGGGGPPRANDDRFAGLISDAGKKALESYDQRFDDPALKCSPSSIVRGWSEPGSASEIIEEDGQIRIKHEYMDTLRIVDMSSKQHPAKIKPSLEGHSVGWYEDATLVIETTNFAAGVLLPHPGLLHSDQMNVIERLTLSEDGSQLTRTYEVTDPLYMLKPYSGQSNWTRSAIPVVAYNCEELSGINNVRPDSEAN